MIRFRLLVLAGLLFTSCSKLTKLTDSITKPSAREVYEREFKKDDLKFREWQNAYLFAQNDSISISLPYIEKGSFNSVSLPTYSYLISLQEGEVLSAEILRDSISHQIFIDLFDADKNLISSQKQDELGFKYIVERSGDYRLIVQPEITAQTNFYILITKSPALAFPVAGKGNAAIQSLWGYERDGGARSHEGVDIFAPRGTPVLAAADGTVGNTGERGIGGKQVWLRTRNYSASLYYAHLDSITVLDGTPLKTGDTLGLVGNTGNAKGGPPHLHFGIYKNGAVNPLPFIFTTEKVKKPSLQNFKRSFQSAKLMAKGYAANLRIGATTNATIIRKLNPDETITLLGESGDWLHVLTTNGQKAFVHKSVVSEVKE